MALKDAPPGVTRMDYPGHSLRVGSTDRAAVKAVQKRLNALGVRTSEGPLAQDGVFGPETELAVRLLQARAVDFQDRPLVADGVVGALTWRALFPEVAAPPPPALDDGLAKVLKVAADQVGVMEEPPGSNSGPQVKAFLASVGLGGGNAWCAAFVYWCFKQADAQTAAPKTGGVHEMWRRAGAAGLLRLTPAQARQAPEKVTGGQLFFLDAGGGFGHVGFIEAVDGAYLTTIEGNTNAGGSRNGVGVFRRTGRKIASISLGFADFTRPL